MSLITNADSRTTPAMQKADDLKGKRSDYIDGKVKQATLAEREQGHGAPDVRFSWQRDDVFTEDTEFDNSRAAIENRTSLPIKEYVLEEDGTLVKDIRGAALEMVKQGKFCSRCEERQPETPEGKKAAWSKRELHVGPAPDGCSIDTNCVYCLGQLGLSGDHKVEKPGFVTDEQLKLMMLAGVIPEGI